MLLLNLLPAGRCGPGWPRCRRSGATTLPLWLLVARLPAGAGVAFGGEWVVMLLPLLPDYPTLLAPPLSPRLHLFLGRGVIVLFRVAPLSRRNYGLRVAGAGRRRGGVTAVAPVKLSPALRRGLSHGGRGTALLLTRLPAATLLARLGAAEDGDVEVLPLLLLDLPASTPQRGPCPRRRLLLSHRRGVAVEYTITRLPLKEIGRRVVRAAEDGGAAWAANADVGGVPPCPGGIRSTSNPMTRRRGRGRLARLLLRRPRCRGARPFRRPTWSAWRSCVDVTRSGTWSSEPWRTSAATLSDLTPTIILAGSLDVLAGPEVTESQLRRPRPEQHPWRSRTTVDSGAPLGTSLPQPATCSGSTAKTGRRRCGRRWGRTRRTVTWTPATCGSTLPRPALATRTVSGRRRCRSSLLLACLRG